ncbi:MAG: GntR family transcriptional regulator [Desulfitobacterium hafniense]|nr:GntR family transcriptional regulator [Desulfitobacterium hafniense]
MSILETPIQWKTKTDMIYHMLREAIVSGELIPGERIVLRKLASDLGVSAIPVREAIKLLEAEGLVDLFAHSEVTVSRFSEKDYRELFEIRVLLEGHAAELAARRVNEEFLGELDQLLGEMRECIERKDYKAYGILNREFHTKINTYSGNEHLQKMIDLVMAKTDRARALFVYYPERIRDSLQGHEDIVKALKQGDAEAVKKIIAEQTQSGCEVFLKYCKNVSGQETC